MTTVTWLLLALDERGDPWQAWLKLHQLRVSANHVPEAQWEGHPQPAPEAQVA